LTANTRIEADVTAWYRSNASKNSKTYLSDGLERADITRVEATRRSGYMKVTSRGRRREGFVSVYMWSVPHSCPPKRKHP